MTLWVVKGNMEFMIQVMVIHSQLRLLSVFLQQMFKRKISTFAVSCFWNIYHWKLKHKNWTFFKRQRHISDKGDFLLWSSNNASKEVWVSGKGGGWVNLQTETGSETRENGHAHTAYLVSLASGHVANPCDCRRGYSSVCRAIGCSPIGPWFKSVCPLKCIFLKRYDEK